MRNLTFGIEIETTGIGRQRTAQAIATYFGTTAVHVGRHLDDWHVTMPDGRKWKVERDGSVTDPSAEIVSPPLAYTDLETLQEVVRAVRKAGAKVDETCGIHIHVDAASHTPQSLRRLVNIVNAKEDLLEQALAISSDRRNTWCLPVEEHFLEALNSKKPTTFDGMAQLWYRYCARHDYCNGRCYERPVENWQRYASTHYDPSRYHLLNLHATFSTEREHPTTEFRAFNATLHAGEIKAYVQLCLAIVNKALTSTAACPTRPTTDNPAYAFRCWLLQLGLIGDEFKTARLHLMKHLQGNGAWRHGDSTVRTQG